LLIAIILDPKVTINSEPQRRELAEARFIWHGLLGATMAEASQNIHEFEVNI